MLVPAKMWAFTGVIAGLFLVAGLAVAQQSSQPGTAKRAPNDNGPTAPAVAAPQNAVGGGIPALPHPNQQMILIRSTLLAVNQANLTGNYTVLRDLGTPDFQRTNSSARLTEIFQNLRSRNIDLGPIAVMDAKLVRPPSINPGGLFRLSGFFPSQPEQVNFDLAFIMIDGRWRLHGIALNTTRPTAATGATAQPTAPPESAKKSAVTKKPAAAAQDPAVRRVAPPDRKAASDKKKSDYISRTGGAKRSGRPNTQGRIADKRDDRRK